MNGKTKVATVLTLTLIACVQAKAQVSSAPEESSAPAVAATPSYQIVDLGTLGGPTSAAAGMAGQQGHNVAGMIVGSSTASDNSAHAFLYSNGQMRDLNELCDLSTSDFNILTTASSIDDSGQIIGAGITANGQTHAFLLKPTPVDGGNWSYSCCQWIWKQASTDNGSGGSQDSGWWWESNCHCYKWHGPPGKHPPCPPNPPHCWYWPLPCPTDMGCSPYPPPVPNPYPNPKVTPTPTPTPTATITPTVTPTPTPHKPAFCWCCVNGKVSYISDILCRARKGQCFATQAEALKDCAKPPSNPGWCCVNGTGVSQQTKEACDALGGTLYPTKESAVKNCQYCWCCKTPGIGGIPEFMPTVQCLQIPGAKCYATQDEAMQNCALGPKSCYCCIKGQIAVHTEDYCLAQGGACYTTLEAAAAAGCVPQQPFLEQHFPINPNHRPRIPNTPNGQLQPPPTPVVTPFRHGRTPSTPTPRVTPSQGGTPSSPVPQVTPAPDTGSKRAPTHKPVPIFHRPRLTPTPSRQPALHRPINKPKPTPTPRVIR